MPLRLSIILLGLALWAPASWAQQGAIEVTPYLGNLSNATVDATRGSARTFGPSGGFVWGAGVSYTVSDNSAIELNWTRRKGQLDVDGVPRVGLDEDVVHLDFVGLIGDPVARMRPYVLGGGGASLMKARRDGVTSVNHFSFSVGCGLKVFLVDSVGIRLQARYVGTYLKDEPRGYWCDPQQGCLYVAQAAFLHQGEYTAGIVLRY